jgi:hypothetical protein
MSELDTLRRELAALKAQLQLVLWRWHFAKASILRGERTTTRPPSVFETSLVQVITRVMKQLVQVSLCQREVGEEEQQVLAEATSRGQIV